MRFVPTRQVHLDFHTSEMIPAVGDRFDPRAFAQTVKDAHVNSVTLFARGHHGWLYYDSKKFPELVHPSLRRRDLLIEQVRALHEVGVRAPIYITVQWDYHSANAHPEWLIRGRDGAHEGGPFTEAGFYQSLCVNTGYIDFLKAQTEEIVTLLGDELDGVFFDIVGLRPCLCASCRKEMKARGVDMNDDEQVRAFAAFVMNRFKRDMTAFVRGMRPDCTIFYNAGHVGTGTRESADCYSHFELESLPSGGWGYLHFPATAAYARMLGKDCLGMTGKFHQSWGDFHSLKNQAALEFEVFRMLSFGFACSIGDQLEPCGTLNPATWRLIGNVYAQVEAREKYARQGARVTEAAVITAESPLHESRMSECLMGAVQLLDEISVQFDILDETMPLDGYRLAILPDDVRISDEFAARLDAFAAAGGAILACGRGGLRESGEYPSCFGVEYSSQNALYPDFIIARGALADGLEPDQEYVIYSQGSRLTPRGAIGVLDARAPYFARSGEAFCSHSYTPSAKGEAYPAAFRNDSALIFSHPLFAQYRQSAPRWVKLLVKNAIRSLLGDTLIAHNGPSTLIAHLLNKDGKTYAHVLSYIPVRKSATIDIIEERTPAYDVTFTLSLDKPFSRARLVPDNVELAVSGNTVKVPKIDGYTIIEFT